MIKLVSDLAPYLVHESFEMLQGTGPFWMFILGKDLDLHGRHVDVKGVLFSTSNIM